MFLSYAFFLLIVDVSYGGKLPICPCEGFNDGSLTMNAVDSDCYPPLQPEKEQIITFDFTVTKHVSRNLLLNVTFVATFQCPNGTVYTEILSCSKNSQYCYNLTGGNCMRIQQSTAGLVGNVLNLVFSLLTSKPTTTYTPCEETLCPGDYQITMLFGSTKFECPLIKADYIVLIMNGPKIVGCYKTSPEFKKPCRKEIDFENTNLI